MNNRMDRTHKDTVDIIAFTKYILRKWYYVILGIIAGIVVSIPIIKLTSAPQYTSETKYYLTTSSEENISYGTLQVSSSIVDDYIAMIKSRTVVQKAIESSELDISEDLMLKMISVSNPDKTHILVVKVNSQDRKQAEDVMSALSFQIVEYIPGIMGGSSLKLIDGPVTSMDNTSLKKMLIVIISVIAFSLISILVLLFMFIKKQTIENPDDIIDEFEGINTFLIPKSNRKFLFNNKNKQIKLQSTIDSTIEEILFSLVFTKQKSKVIMITSPLSGEGSSFLATRLYEKLQKEKIEAELVNDRKETLQETVEKLKNSPGIVIVDASPILQTLKPLFLADLCDKIVLVAKHKATSMYDLRKAVYKFRNNGFDVHAIVLNQYASIKDQF